MHSLRLWATLAGLLLGGFVLGQITISGTVVEADTPDAVGLVGVNVYLPNTTTGTVTDIDGQFSIRVPETALGESLSFTYVGYQPVEYTIAGNASDVVIEMIGSAIVESEIVVTALGINRERRQLGYATQSLENEALTDVPAVNFVDNLAAQVAGVRVTAGATGVGSTSQIVIRGQPSFTNNNPLFVVNGTPINNNTTFNFTNEAAAGFQEVDFGNGAMELPAEDIESVTVLKGPAAAALYGTRAANGVIQIQTKRARPNSEIGISFNSSFFLDRPFQLPEFQNEFGQGQGGEFRFVDGLGAGVSDNITYSYGPRLDQGLLIDQFDSPRQNAGGVAVASPRGGDTRVGAGPIEASPFVSRPDNVRDFYETGTTAVNNLAISKAFDGGSFRLSATDLRSDSYIPGVNYKRQNVLGSFDFAPTERLSVNALINYVNAGSDNRPAAGYGSENIGYSLTAWYPRQADTEALREYWQRGLEGTQQYSFNYTFFDNPFFTLFENRNEFNRDRVFGNLSARYDLRDNLSVTLRGGLDQSNEQRRFLRAFSSNRFPEGAYAENDVAYREINTDLLVEYRPVDNRRFGLDLFAGANRLDQTASNAQRQAVTLAQPGVYRLSNAAGPVEIFDQTAEKRINSVYGLAKFRFDDFLFLDVTGRQDWSSALAVPASAAGPGSTDNTGFFYPSVSLGFIASEVFDLPQNIDLLKLRGSWAQVGNDTDPYRTSSVFVAQTPFMGRPTFSENNVLAARDLVPERTSATELGLDLAMLNYRVRLDVSYYNQITDNQILSLPVPASSGFNQRITNGGRVRNEGLEAVLTLNPVRSRSFNWSSTFNFSTNRATVEELPDETERFTVGFARVYNSVNQTVFFIAEEGGEIGDIWGTGYLRNDDGELVLNADGGFIADNNLRKLGNANPDFTLGWFNQFRYRNLSLGFLLDWRQGGELVSRTLALAGVAGQLAETANRPEEGFVIEGVQNVGTADSPEFVENTTPVSAESFYRSFYNRNHEENNIYDAGFVKLRELSLTYVFPERLLESTFLRGAQDLSISLIGRNLYAWSAIPHFDPEQFAIQGNQIVGGVEDISYPSARSFGVRLGVRL